MGSRVVRPETTKLHISDGDWLLVKKRLTHGEQSAAFQRRYHAQADGVLVNLSQVDLAQVTAYLLDWSLVDLDDRLLVIRGEPIDNVEAALNSLEPESFAEIATAIRTHEAAMQAERVAEKNVQSGESAPPAISPLRAVAGGGTNG